MHPILVFHVALVKQSNSQTTALKLKCLFFFKCMNILSKMLILTEVEFPGHVSIFR